MNSVLELLHTCLGVCGCFCLEEEFWRARSSSGGSGGTRERVGTARRGGSGMLVRPRPQAFRDMEELLLDPRGADGSMSSVRQHGGGGSVDGEEEEEGRGSLSHAVSSGSEDMYRLGSFNTKVNVLRSQSPFYRSQQHHQGPAAGGGLASSSGGGSGLASSSGGGGAGAGVDIELKPTGSNMLLGQQHLEQRGKFVDAHPGGVIGASSAHASSASAVRRGPSPQLGAPG